MSDLASQFYNAWVGVMGGKPLRLLCTWHVDKAWQTELRAKVKDTGKAYLKLLFKTDLFNINKRAAS